MPKRDTEEIRKQRNYEQQFIAKRFTDRPKRQKAQGNIGNTKTKGNIGNTKTKTKYVDHPVYGRLRY